MRWKDEHRLAIMEPAGGNDAVPGHTSGPWVYQVFNLVDVVEGANAQEEKSRWLLTKWVSQSRTRAGYREAAQDRNVKRND